MQGMITAKASIKFHLISTKTGILEDSFIISELGAGFSRNSAEELAIEKILDMFENRIFKTISLWRFIYEVCSSKADI